MEYFNFKLFNYFQFFSITAKSSKLLVNSSFPLFQKEFELLGATKSWKSISNYSILFQDLHEVNKESQKAYLTNALPLNKKILKIKKLIKITKIKVKMLLNF